MAVGGDHGGVGHDWPDVEVALCVVVVGAAVVVVVVGVAVVGVVEPSEAPADVAVVVEVDVVVDVDAADDRWSATPVVAAAECAEVSEATSTPSPMAVATAPVPINVVIRRTRTMAWSLVRRAEASPGEGCRFRAAMSSPL